MAAPEPNPSITLKQRCRDAILKARGETDKAYEALNLWLLRENSAVLERELTASYRSIAIRALLAEQYNELRAEGKLPRRARDTPITTTEYERPRGSPSAAARRRDTGLGEVIEVSRRSYLDTFLVNGRPIGDCTVEEVEANALARERDVTFMLALIEGLPPGAIIRDHRTNEDAARLYEAARQKNFLGA
jgi:hypothetical protein